MLQCRLWRQEKYRYFWVSVAFDENWTACIIAVMWAVEGIAFRIVPPGCFCPLTKFVAKVCRRLGTRTSVCLRTSASVLPDTSLQTCGTRRNWYPDKHGNRALQHLHGPTDTLHRFVRKTLVFIPQLLINGKVPPSKHIEGMGAIYVPMYGVLMAFQDYRAVFLK